LSNGLHLGNHRRARSRARRRVGAVLVGALAAWGLAAFTAGAASYHGSAASAALSHPIVDMAATPSGNGYWLVASDGGIFGFGDAHYFGSTGHLKLKAPIVGMASTATGHGYWLVASDGGVFSFGDAHFYGSTGSIRLVKPIVGMAATPTGHGYWMVASDGGIFGFGDAHFYGSAGSIRLARPMVGMAASPSGHGYWMVASDGGIFGYGDAHFFGSTGAITLAEPIVGMAATRLGHGYWLVASDGGVFNYGSAHYYGSAANLLAGQQAVAIERVPAGGGYWIPSQWGAIDSGGSSGMQIDPNLVPHNSVQAIENEIVNRINTERNARGLHPLAFDPLLHTYAESWARHLASTSTFDHQDLVLILQAADGRLEQAGENLFEGSGPGATDAGTAHNALMHSPGHRANILLPEERFVGVGAACMNGSLVVVEDFGTPTGIPLLSHPTPPLDPIAAGSLGGASC